LRFQNIGHRTIEGVSEFGWRRQSSTMTWVDTRPLRSWG
jgi:hypothetical protein